jgi:phosphoribosylformylglycinamidine cyclo-ligase
VSGISYKDAGVDIEKGARFARGIYGLMHRTFTERVVENPDGFGCMFSLDYDEELFRRNYKHPVLVSGTDGVGTKLKVAFRSGKHDTVGIDLVAMCANDILVQGAEPLFFLDYLATGKLEGDVLTDVVRGIGEGCMRAGAALIGGETAEMPGFYADGEYDMAGFCVGVVEKDRIIDGSRIEPGDQLVGLPSSGLHSNGYSLARKLMFEVEGLEAGDPLEKFGIGRTVAEELLEPTRIYVKPVRAVFSHYRIKQVITGIVHVTGGGLLENVPRVLPEGCAAEIDPEAWQRPAIFDALQQIGQVSPEDMYTTFNMGIGLVLLVKEHFAASVMRQLAKQGEEPILIGRVVEGGGGVTIE